MYNLFYSKYQLLIPTEKVKSQVGNNSQTPWERDKSHLTYNSWRTHPKLQSYFIVHVETTKKNVVACGLAHPPPLALDSCFRLFIEQVRSQTLISSWHPFVRDW